MNKALQAIQKYAFGRIQQAGLGDSDFRVLEALLHEGRLAVNTIGPKVNFTPGSISVAVDRLYSKGLVTRVESAEDRCIRIVVAHSHWQGAHHPIFRKHAADIRRAFAEIPSNELGQFERTLKKVGRRAEQLGLGEEQKE
jgi:MarR family transcriptional regulator, 2-MHQ and catechol-resistance regulon repressor